MLDKWGRIDALVNNAGTTKFVKHDDLEGLSADDILGIFRVNLVGPWQMIRACAPALKASRGCDRQRLVGRRGARHRLVDRLRRLEGGARDDELLARARARPGDPRQRRRARLRARRRGRSACTARRAPTSSSGATPSVAPLKTAADAEDVAEAIAWLIEGARRVTGEIIYVDAGMHIASPR